MGRLGVILPLLPLLLSGCYDSFEQSSSLLELEVPSANTTIEHLHERYEMGMRTVAEDMIVEGVVTANDEYGNFYKTFVIENGGYAIEVLAGIQDSFLSYPLGSTVLFSLNGFALDRYQGVLRVGAAASATSSYSLDYIGYALLTDYYLVVKSVGDPVTACPFSCDELDSSHVGRLISVEGLAPCSEDGVERSWSGYSLFLSSELDSIWCYTSSYADFASSIIPQQEVSLSGVLLFGSTDSLSDQFIIKMRSEEDCTF